MYRVILTRRARKSLEKSPKQIRERVVAAIDTLQGSYAPSRTFNIKKLKGLDNTYRIREGVWRIIYEARKDEGIVIVHDILPRKKAYR